MKGGELEAPALCAAVQIGFSHVGAGGARLLCNGGQHDPLSLSLSESCAEIQVVTYSENHCWLDPCLRCCVECSVVPSEYNVSDEPSRDGDTSVEKSQESNPMAAAAHADQGNPSVIGPTVSASSVPGSGSLSSNFYVKSNPVRPSVHVSTSPEPKIKITRQVRPVRQQKRVRAISPLQRSLVGVTNREKTARDDNSGVR